QTDCRINRPTGSVLEEAGRRCATRRTDRAGALWFASGPVGSARRGNSGEGRGSREGRFKRAGTLACGSRRETRGGPIGASQGREFDRRGQAKFLMSDLEQLDQASRMPRIRNPKLRRGIFLLPSLFTVGNLLCGYYASVATLVGNSLHSDPFDHAS